MLNNPSAARVLGADAMAAGARGILIRDAENWVGLQQIVAEDAEATAEMAPAESTAVEGVPRVHKGTGCASRRCQRYVCSLRGQSCLTMKAQFQRGKRGRRPWLRVTLS
ncbi:expressed unknown protein [Ectocarpus siliculosus]|uniref:Uncharacterized protein n=1 Tax=Ectocarpus siliculosus TaxID=2880 RepID=D7FLW8_ECTSI|nr:expressed unknown protein [Ectocarpus siliculosus]|eukprot:CBJ29764.1 expressed unknown protein [Ectocarpus siliculosus]